MSVSSIAEWLISQWTARFSEILLTMGDLQAHITVEPAGESAIKGGLLWWEQPFSCSPDFPMWAGTPEATWQELGNLVLAAAGVEDSPVTEIQSTFTEILRQSMGSLASDIGERISGEVSTGSGVEAPARKISRQIFELEAKLPNQSVFLTIVIADGLCHAIEKAESAKSTPAPAPRVEERLHHDGSLTSRTFDLLLDVEMPVSVSFGRATLTMKEAIQLITGSLIELDRGLSDPVELLVNDCVIARGEVVVVEGNYGVRITEIVSQKERLQQTRRYMLQ